MEALERVKNSAFTLQIQESSKNLKVKEEVQEECWPWDPHLNREVWQEAR